MNLLLDKYLIWYAYDFTEFQKCLLFSVSLQWCIRRVLILKTKCVNKMLHSYFKGFYLVTSIYCSKNTSYFAGFKTYKIIIDFLIARKGIRLFVIESNIMMKKMSTSVLSFLLLIRHFLKWINHYHLTRIYTGVHVGLFCPVGDLAKYSCCIRMLYSTLIKGLNCWKKHGTVAVNLLKN